MSGHEDADGIEGPWVKAMSSGRVPIHVWTEGGYVRLSVPAKTVTGQTTFLLSAAEARELAAAIHVAAGGER
jgi:hypothetical protein